MMQVTQPSAADERAIGAATVAGIVACLIWSCAVVVSGTLASAFGGLTACALELMIAGSVLLAIRFRRGELSQLFSHSRRYFLVCGSCWIANFAFFWLAVSSVTNSEQLVIAGLINYLWPSLTLLGAVLILKRAARWILLPGLGLAIAGIVFARASLVPAGQLVSQLREEPNLLAYLYAAIDAVAWALYSNYSRRYARPGAAGAIPLFMLVASLPLLLLGRVRGEVIEAGLYDLLLLMLWSALAACAYVGWDFGMRVGRVVAISSFSLCIPLVSTVITAWIGGVPLSLGLVVGAAAVVLGAAVCRRAVDD